MEITLGAPPAPVLGAPDRMAPAVREARAKWPVALVSMPFVSMTRPSIQLGLLKPIADSHGFPARTFHLGLDFAKQIGPELYHLLCEQRGRAVGDWLFSLAAFGDAAPDPHDRLLDEKGEDIREMLKGSDVSLDRLREVRHRDVPAYLAAVLDAIPWDEFGVVGFTSTFQQNVASFALAGALKARFPDLVMLFGGANFEGDMGRELVRSVPCIDYAISGEADTAFPAFLIALADGIDPTSAPGVLARRGGKVAEPPEGRPFDRLDELPVPDYDEFFRRAEALGFLRPGVRREVDIPFESARGCWWGAKRHCTFCGLNGTTMTFRAKSPGRVRRELAALAYRYRSFDLEAVDNIVDPTYIDTLFRELARSGVTYRLFYEVKANLTRAQLRTMRDAGVKQIQPGIESLSSHVLGLMRKGTRASQNVNVMRWGTHYGMGVAWNLLWGFPGETEEDYRQQAALLPHLFHLPPPAGGGRIWMERFSPIFTDQAAFPLNWRRPEASLAFVYPAEVDLDRAAYFFEYELQRTLPDSAFTELNELISAWKEAWSGPVRPALRVWHSPGLIQIEDARKPDEPGTYTFDEPFASLYLACSERAMTAAEARHVLGLTAPVEQVEEALDAFTERGLMMRDGNLFLALALPATGGV